MHGSDGPTDFMVLDTELLEVLNRLLQKVYVASANALADGDAVLLKAVLGVELVVTSLLHSFVSKRSANPRLHSRVLNVVKFPRVMARLLSVSENCLQGDALWRQPM